MILRDRDMTDSGGKVDFTGRGDGTLEERVYYCQNWRADVSALVAYTSGQTVQVEHDKYLSYGTPWGLPAGDLNSDGDYDANDEKDVDSLISTGGYDVRADANLDGLVKAADKTLLSGAKITLGRGFMSGASTFNRRGYAGYENDGVLGDGAVAGSNTRFWHVRHRVMDSTMGRWTRRDPAGYVDGATLIAYSSGPITFVDPSGTFLLTPCLVGGGIGGAVGLISDLITGGSGCSGLGGAAAGCCTAQLCTMYPKACLYSACICQALGAIITAWCDGTFSNPCTIFSATAACLVGAAGGALGQELKTIPRWLLALMGFDAGMITNLCVPIRAVFPTGPGGGGPGGGGPGGGGPGGRGPGSAIPIMIPIVVSPGGSPSLDLDDPVIPVRRYR